MEDNDVYYATPRELRVKGVPRARPSGWEEPRVKASNWTDPALFTDPNIRVIRKPLFSRVDGSQIVNRKGEQRYSRTFVESYPDGEIDGRRTIKASNVLRKNNTVNDLRKPIPPDLQTTINIPKKLGGGYTNIIIPGEKLQRYALTYYKLLRRPKPTEEQKAKMKAILNAVRVVNGFEGNGAWKANYGRTDPKSPNYSWANDNARQISGFMNANKLIQDHHNSAYGFTTPSGGVTEKSVRDYLQANGIVDNIGLAKMAVSYYQRMIKGRDGMAYRSKADVLEQIRKFLSKEIPNPYAGQDSYRPTTAGGTRYKDF